MREDQSDGLRVFAVYELCKLLRISLLERIEGSHFGTQGLHHAVQPFLSLLGSIGADQEFAGVFNSSLENVVVRRHHLIAVFQHGFDLITGDGLDLGDFTPDCFRFILSQMFERLRRHCVAKHNGEDGSLADTAHFAVIGGRASHIRRWPLFLGQPGSQDVRYDLGVLFRLSANMFDENLGFVRFHFRYLQGG